MEFIYHDGGRAAAGYKGDSGDCVVRAIAIATGIPYQQIYDELNLLGKSERISKRRKVKSSSRDGVYKSTTKKYLEAKGWKWVPTMFIGSGCKVHLKKDELPSDVLIVKVSKHVCAVVFGVIYDKFDPSRNETRCVYGYYQKVSA